MKKRSKKLRLSSVGINCGALTILLYAMLAGDPIHTIALILAAAIHEVGHILAAHTLDIPINELKLDLLGASLTIGGMQSYRKERILCAMGPLFNLIGFLISRPFCAVIKNGNVCNAVSYFGTACICLMVINLLPVRNFDGGRILYSLLCEYIGIRTADTVLDILTFINVGILWVVSVYMILKFQSALSMFTFSVMLFVKIFVKEDG